jgi:uncharacterized protein (DUF934 family)
MQIIKNGRLEQDDWQHVADGDALPATRYTVSYNRWLNDRNDLMNGSAEIGVRLSGDVELANMGSDLGRLALIVIEFPAMADGRGFSLARLLRARYRYAGEIRARGDFIRDQAFFLKRVGVNAFERLPGRDLADLLPALEEFSVTYQSSSDQIEPLYRRHLRT